MDHRQLLVPVKWLSLLWKHVAPVLFQW